jgi:membrane-associated phospholipid phosphatase
LNLLETFLIRRAKLPRHQQSNFVLLIILQHLKLKTMRSKSFLVTKVVVVLAGILCTSSFQGIAQSTDRTKPSTWKPLVIQESKFDKPSPPSSEQLQKEVAEVKKKMATNNTGLLRHIAYWDSGPPSYRWNQIGYQLTGAAFRVNNGITFFRAPMAWMNLAIYDATLMAWKLKEQHPRKRPFEVDASIHPVIAAPSTSSYPCEHAVTAGAAATVLAHFFPEVADSIITLGKQAAESRVAAGVQFPSDVAQGWALGEKVAAMIIEKSKSHLSDAPWKGNQPTDDKHWKGPYPVGAIASTFKPLLLKSGDQFRPSAPPDFTSEMQQMKEFKQNFVTTSQAFYWAAHSGLDIWTDLASTKMFEYHLERNTPECARIYTMLNLAMYDCIIAIMDAKYAYFGIRPDQMDPGFKPLIGHTPPFPGYPSGHATASATAASILGHVFPQDSQMFKQTAKECADSRFFAGIHFPTDNRVGLELGQKIGDYVFEVLNQQL